jgi:hypothetical protein
MTQWKKRASYAKPDDWIFASKRYRGRKPYWGQAILRNTFVLSRRVSELRDYSDGTLSATPTRLCCEVWEPSSR